MLMVCCICLVPASAQTTPTPDPDAAFRTLEEFAIDTRGLPALAPVTRDFPTRDEVREYIRETFDLTLTTDVIDELSAFYMAFDFISPETDLRAVFDELYGQQVAGYYDTETKVMNVVTMSGGDNLGLLDEIIFVHEYVHALQDQHFDLAAYLGDLEDETNGDLAMARLSLVEGDATFVMNEYTTFAAQENPLGALLEIATAGMQAGNMSLPASTPDIIGAELLFPYLSGEVFVRALLADGGLAALDAAYRNPPRLHRADYPPGQILRGRSADSARSARHAAERGLGRRHVWHYGRILPDAVAGYPAHHQRGPRRGGGLGQCAVHDLSARVGRTGVDAAAGMGYAGRRR